MFGEASAIDRLREQLNTIIGELSESTSVAVEKLRIDLAKEIILPIPEAINQLREEVVTAIDGSAASRDAHLVMLIESLNTINSTLKRFFKPQDPKPVKLVITGESEMANMLGFKIVLPTLPPEPNDIVSGELTVQVGAGEAAVVATTKQQTEVVDLAGEEGATVNVSYVYVDNAGNRSETASTLSVVLVDTIAPAVPGVLGVVVTSEFTTEDPAPPEEPPAPPEEPVV